MSSADTTAVQEGEQIRVTYLVLSTVEKAPETVLSSVYLRLQNSKLKATNTIQTKTGNKL